MSGILILDNDCYSHLEDEHARMRFRANLKTIDFVAQPTELTLVEAGVAPAARRARVLGVMRELKGNQPLLLWPIALLKKISLAIVAGDPHLVIGASGKEWYLDDEAAIAQLVTEVQAFRLKLEYEYSVFHAKNRARFQRELKRLGLQADFESAADFLDSVWLRSPARQEYVDATWRGLQLPGAPPMNDINRNECWRLLLDGEGLAFYERVLVKVQPKRVHRADLLQLVYLGASPRRMIATADGPFLRAANTILTGRYGNARAVNISDLTH